jgi:peptide/nickel transport system substrate-binding protein
VTRQSDHLSPEISTLADAFRAGRMNRRQVLARLAALGLSAPAAAALFSAPGFRAEAAAQATPQRSGGRLVVSMSQSPSSLDPAFGINAPEFSITSWIYDNLVWLGPDLVLKPMLATEWTPNDDASVWTFTLRDDVTFSNGRQLVADDVVFSISRVLNPDTGSPGRSGLGPIDTVEAPDPQTVVFTLASPYADFPLELSQRWGRIVAKEAEANLATEPLGSGPFTIAEYVPGSHVVVVRNEAHWDPNAGLVDEIELRTFPDEIAEITALQNGDVHIMYDVPAAAHEQISGFEDVQISEVPTGTWIPMIMRVDTPPFDKPQVREAIKYCMDRTAFVDAVLFGHGTVANDHNVPPNHPFVWVSDPRPRDIEKAKQLLAEAELPDGFEFELVAATDRAIRADTAVTIQQMVKDAGITFNVRTIDYDTYIAQVYKKGPLYIGYWGMRPTLDSQMVPFFSTDGSFNEYAYSNPALDEKLFAARAELDAEARKALYQEAQQILSAEGPVLIPYFLNVASAFRSEVVGFEAHPLTTFDLRYVSLGG